MMSNIIRFSKRKGLLSMQNYVITITRQFGSRGRDIGIATAKKLGIPLYDRNVLEKEAEEIDSTLHSLVEFSKNGMSSSGYYKMAYPLGIGSSLKKDRMFEVQSKLVLQHAETENCVIIGRCADYVLDGTENLVRLFVYAEIEERINKVREKGYFPEEDILKNIKRIDRERRDYYRYYTGKSWENLENYDLMINTTKLSYDDMVECVVDYLKMRGILAK